jgi:hypothetical protein
MPPVSERPPNKDELVERILQSPSYRRADQDTDFLNRDELRAVRLQLDLLKPELIQSQEGIHSTIVVFGSSRLVEPAEAREHLARAEAALAQKPEDPDRRRVVEVAGGNLPCRLITIRPGSSDAWSPQPAKWMVAASM